MQTTINLGRVVPSPKGTYTTGRTYNRLDMVMYGGNGYICVVNNTTAVPSLSQDWRIIVDASQLDSMSLEEIIMKNGDIIEGTITTSNDGIEIEGDINQTGDLTTEKATVTDGNDVVTINPNSIKVEDVDQEFTEITSTQVNTPEVLTQKVAFSNSEISETDDGENFILQMRAGIIDIDADAVSISEVNTQRLIANSTQSLINIESNNSDNQIIFHKNGKTVQLKDGVLGTDVANVKELNMNADGTMGGVIAFGDKNGSENLIEISEREDDELTIQAPEIDLTAPSNTIGLPNIYFKQKSGTTGYDNYNTLNLTWDTYSSGSNRKRPNITTELGLSMNSGQFASPIYFNYYNVWSNLTTFKFQHVELPYTWRGSTIEPIFKVGKYQIKHVNGEWGDTEIGEYDKWLNVYNYNSNKFFNGISLTSRYDDGEGGYEIQDYIYFSTFDGEQGEESGVINAEFGLNYTGKEFNIWDWNENDKFTLKTVYDDNTDETEHIISAPNKLTISSEDQVVIDGLTTHITSDELKVSVDSVDIDSDNDIELTTNGASVKVNGTLVVTSGNTLKIGNTTITEAQLQALLQLIQ